MERPVNYTTCYLKNLIGGEGEKQEMTLIQEDDEGNFQNTYYGEFSFVPMLEKRSNTKS